MWYNRGMKDEIKAAFKAPQVDALLSEIIFNGKDRVTCISEGICVTCDEAHGLVATSFRDDISRKEYSISGMCQSCQDDVFGHGEPEDEDWDDHEDYPEDPMDSQWADDDALSSAGWGTDESYF
jgi:hypothetical protein|tara:strand:- start:39 stop:410 length:372 start_codon:yes stop_codon:yes gene_type:complete